MAYIHRQKFDLRSLAQLPVKPQRRVLFVGVDDVLHRIYCLHFVEQGYEVYRSSIDAARPKIQEAEPHVVFINIDTHALQEAMVREITKLAQLFPHIPIVSLARGLDAEVLKRLMRAGITSHVDRTLTTPRDLVIITENILV